MYADKAYHGEPNRTFLHLNDIEGVIMQNETTRSKITQEEIKMNRKIARKR